MRPVGLLFLGLPAFAKQTNCQQKEEAARLHGPGYTLFKDIECFPDGRYKPVQKFDDSNPETKGKFACVTPLSGKVRFVLGYDRNSKRCQHADFVEPDREKEPCAYAYYKVMMRFEQAERDGRGIMDLSALECSDDGLYKPLQIDPRTGNAYCVDVGTGGYVGKVNLDPSTGEETCGQIYQAFVFKISAKKIPKMDGWGIGSAPDCYFRLFIGDRLIYSSKMIKNNHNPSFRKFMKKASEIPLKSQIRLVMYDDDWHNSHDFIGDVVFSVEALLGRAKPTSLAFRNQESGRVIIEVEAIAP